MYNYAKIYKNIDCFFSVIYKFLMVYTRGLVQKGHNSSALAMELHISCTNLWL